MMRKPLNAFIDPALAEPRDIQCGWCGKECAGHLAGCPHCQRPFFANMHGYARLCKNPNCRRTECAGHAHGLCRMHHENRKAKQASSAAQPNCRCGGKASFGHTTCRRCREADEARAERDESISRCPHGVKQIFGNVCSECQDDYIQMRRDDQRGYENRG